MRNGKEENLTEDHGYIKISGKMYKEIFEISFDAEPVFVHANPQVRVDSAKVAVVKGPLVYCVEEADNGENLSWLILIRRLKKHMMTNFWKDAVYSI